MTRQDDVERQLDSWRDEIDSAALYRAPAELEPEPRVAEVYRRLAATEERHAVFWGERLRQRRAGAGAGPGWRTGLLIALARRASAPS
jgi:vacuolar iron transporter family protein